MVHKKILKRISQNLEALKVEYPSLYKKAEAELRSFRVSLQEQIPPELKAPKEFGYKLKDARNLKRLLA